MEAHVLSHARMHPTIGVSIVNESASQELLCSLIRAIIGDGARIYLITDNLLLSRLQTTLGRSLTLPSDAIRVWWPGLSLRSDPTDHPLILEMAGEDYESLMVEFERQFELSRPYVRAEIRQIEELRALAERERKHAVAQQHKLENRFGITSANPAG
jgi:hypothetical protein